MYSKETKYYWIRTDTKMEYEIISDNNRGSVKIKQNQNQYLRFSRSSSYVENVQQKQKCKYVTNTHSVQCNGFVWLLVELQRENVNSRIPEMTDFWSQLTNDTSLFWNFEEQTTRKLLWAPPLTSLKSKINTLGLIYWYSQIIKIYKEVNAIFHATFLNVKRQNRTWKEETEL